MILTDRELQAFLASNQITINPPPAPHAFSSTSLDLTLDEPGEIWKDLPGQPVRPNTPGYTYRSLDTRKQRISLNGYSFKKQTLLLAWTKEDIVLPYSSRVAARVEGKSGLARLGLMVHMTAPTIHAGFRGQIQLEMYNLGPYDIILDAGMTICQLIFEITFGTPAKGYGGQFSGQTADALISTP
ncbi:MAG TPA: dCTP deaminase [Stellaceae bacterium]|jgi:dCTP deaminase|nr:dCTP deaminase [Stellaceae bacterium]